MGSTLLLHHSVATLSLVGIFPGGSMSTLNKHHDQGFSLIEMIIVVAILAIIAAGFSQILWDSKKFQSHIELKGEAVDFKNMMALTLKSSETCKKALKLDDDVVKFLKKDIPHYEGDTLTCPTGDSDCKKPVGVRLKAVEIVGHEKYDASTFSGGRVAKADDAASSQGTKLNPRLYLHDIQIEFKRPLGSSGDNKTTYITNLVVQINKVRSDASVGSAELKLKQPVIFKLAEDGDKFKVADCFLDSGDDPQAQCIKLGGRWLSNTNNMGSDNSGSVRGITNASCPKTRLDTGNSSGKCIFSNNYPLEPKELPDGIPCKGNQNVDNERPAFCFNETNSSKVTQIACPSIQVESQPGKKCIYDQADKRWKFVRQKGNGSYVTIKECNKGVEITKADSGMSVLSWNEPINAADPNAIADLQNVDRCLVDIKNNKYLDCQNGDDQDLTDKAKGTCVWFGTGHINGANAQVTRNRINFCNATLGSAECPTNVLANYQGWIYVNKVGKTGGVPDPNKSKGIPCFEVEVSQ